jgi:hypothetical protein
MSRRISLGRSLLVPLALTTPTGVPTAAAPDRTVPVVLAVREARRAIERDSRDAKAYFQLARTYAALSEESDERKFGQRMPLLAQLRHVQTTAALRHALLLDPDLAAAHRLLSIQFRHAGYADLEQRHLGEYVRLARRAGRMPDETEEQFNNRLQKLDKEHAALKDRVADSRNKYQVKSAKKPVLERARIALALGLAETALQVLLDSDSLEFGVAGALLELDLLLRTGRLEDLREQIAPANDAKLREQLAKDLGSALGVGVYEQYRFLLAVGEGDYKEADEFLRQATKRWLTDGDLRQRYRRQMQLEGKDPGPCKDLGPQELLAVGVGKVIAQNMPQDGPVGWLVMRRLEHAALWASLREMIMPLQFASDYETLRGILKLETGDIRGAGEHFRKALFAHDPKEKTKDEPRTDFDFPGRPAADHYLKLIKGRE